MKKLLAVSVLATVLLTATACSSLPRLVFDEPTTAAAVPTAVLVQPTQVVENRPVVQSQPSAQASSSALVADPLQMDATLTALYERINPGVVSILVTTSQGSGTGSGFVFDKKGNIITNYHVVEGATSIEVDFPSGRKVRGKVVATDLDSDLSVVNVSVDEKELVSLTLGDSDALKVGQTVIALGNPFGLSNTMTLGILSAKGRTLESLRQSSSGGFFSSGDILQTDASINPGNSGGPLLNLKGEVIGINRAIRTTGSTTSGQPVNSGIGFSIPINIVRRVIPALISSGKYDYPYMGLSFRPELTLDDVEALGLSQQTGAYIVEVTAGGPGDQAGLRAPARSSSTSTVLRSGGDLVIAVDGRPVQVFNDLIGYVLSNKSPGDKINLTIIRDNQKKEVVLTLGKRP